MPGIRFQLDLYIPEDPNGVQVAGLKVPAALAAKIPAIRQGVRELKSFARIINPGKVNEEMNITAKWQICHHEDPGNIPCGPWQDI